ncbi:MAG: serine/threonine-protein kinase [Lachnospiraceae bacterium]
MTRTGTVIDGKYEILKQVGKGGMSIVYLAMDKRLNKQWAVKEVQKNNERNNQVMINALLAETNLMKKLDHPALPRIVDIIENADTYYIIMDYIEGESLDKSIVKYGAQSEEVVLDWAKQLCDALNYLHSQKPPIIYRDMKPSNIMLKPAGNLKLVDFGIAREYKDKTRTDTTVLGTPGYAPPEQHRGTTDQRSDIYALGMTLHHLLTGIDPRTAGYEYLSVRQWKPSLSEGMEAIIDKCTAINPEDRYQNCAELMYDLEHPDLIAYGYKKKQKRKLVIFLLSFFFFLLFSVAAILFYSGAVKERNNTYEILTSSAIAAASLEEKRESYKTAIEIYPGRIEAYICLLEAYQAEGTFSRQENDEFLALYNANQDAIERTATAVETANLNYQIGMIYFNYYTNEDGSVSISSRINKSYSFFAKNHEKKEELWKEQFAYQTVSECYYQICDFYKKFIFDTVTIEEASKDNYLQLFGRIYESLDSIKESGAYNQLSLCNGTFMLLYDQRIKMAQVDVEQEKVENLLNIVYQRAKSLSVNKEQSRKLQTEILNKYAEYKEAIQRAYDAERRKD